MIHTITTTPVARKQHLCEMCGVKIIPGEKYVNQRVIGGGTAATTKRHAFPCDAAFNEYAEECGPDIDGNIPYDWVIAWAYDHAGLYDSAAALYQRMNNA